MLQDARYALRSFLKAPGFAAVAIVSVALGIGLNTTIFSLVNAVVLRPVPGAEPDRLIAVFTSADTEKFSSSSYPDFLDLAANNTTLDGLMAHSLMFAGVERGQATSITVGEIVSPNYFDVLGVRPAAGRGFQAGDERPGAAPTTVISHRMWVRDFGGRPDAIGRDLTIRGRKYSIVGVAPRGFNGLAAGVSAELWVPAGVVNDVEPVGVIDVLPSATGTHRNEQRGQRYLFLTGRLKHGVTIDQARANLDALSASLEREHPVSNRSRRSTIVAASSVRVHPALDQALAPSAIVLMSAVGLVLLIACSNIASLLLARATSRAREMAVRVAIGASRGAIIRQLLVESVMLSAIGGAVGLLLAVWVAGVLSRFQPPMQVSIAFDFSPDYRVFLFTFALALVTGVVFGLAPALRASRPNLVPALKGDAERTRHRRFSMRSVLVAGQMALSAVLIVVAGLLFRSFVSASRADVGFDASKVVYAAINSNKQFADNAQAQRFFEEAERRIAALPGVTEVARVDRLPFALTNNTNVLNIPGIRGSASGGTTGTLNDGGVMADVTNVSPAYFRALGIEITRGRAFDSRDRGVDSLPVAIINHTAAAKYWPGRDPIGQRFAVQHGREFTIIGIAADHPVRAIGERPRPFFHFAIDQTRVGFANLIARTDGSARDLTPLVRKELLALEPRLAFLGLEPITGMINATLFPARAAMTLLGSFSALALVLAIVGLYGVVSFNVARQTRDIGLRMALGADRGRVLRGVIAQSFSLVGTGAIIGLVLAAGAAQLLSSFLVGISPFDLVTYGGAAAILSTAALVASLVPARRAASVDPLAALRSQ
jgi:predicted permease